MSQDTSTRRKPGGVAADASFLETLDQTASVLDLHRSNLLRLQAEELVNECRLGNGTMSQVNSFVEKLTPLLESVSISKIDESTLTSCPFKFHTKRSQLLEGLKKKLPKKDMTLQVRPFTPLTESTASSVFHHLGRGCCGLTKASGNANVLPTFDVILRMPNSLWEAKDYKSCKYLDVRYPTICCCFYHRVPTFCDISIVSPYCHGMFP